MSRLFSFDSMQMTARDVPHTGHRMAAACFVTIPSAAMLTATLWALSGTATSPLAYALTGLVLFLALLPFSLTIQAARANPRASAWVNARADQMKLARFGLFALSFIALLLTGPTQIFAAIPFSVNLTALQTGAVVLAVSWTTWLCLQTAHVARVTKDQL